ncbi:glycosyltransferase [Chloroflexota bacterium]
MGKSSMQMRICYLANATVVNTHTHRWINYFAEHGWKVDLITWRSPAYAEIHPDITIHRILFPPHYIARYGALLEMAWLLRKIRPDIIHAHCLSHFGILAGLYSRLSGFRPIVLTAWGSDVLVDAKGWKKRLVKYALKRADCITCQGENVAKAMAEMGVDLQRIKLIAFGVDVDKFCSLQEGERLKESLGIVNAPAVISIRNFEQIYDVESLIKAIPLVLKEVPEAKFLIAGDGSQEAGLKGLAESLGISNSTKFIGFIPHDELPQYLASSDIYVSTSLSDCGLAVSTAEAMACGLPVVITDIADHRRWAEAGLGGFIVPARDPKSLAAKVLCILRNGELARRFGQTNRQLVMERFNYYEEMQKMESIYEQLLGLCPKKAD